MQTEKRIKYKFLAPGLISVAELFLGRRGRNTISIPDKNLDFVILGSGRNGSTLLGLLLNNHSKLFLPPEQFALPFSIMKWRLYLHRNWDKFTSVVLEDFSRSNANWDIQASDYEKIGDALRSWAPVYHNVGNIYREIYHYYSNKIDGQAPLTGDHSPIMTTFFRLIESELTDTKYIFLIRHPLDVVLSHLKMEGRKTLNARQAAKKWKESLDIYHLLTRHQPEKVILIKYEDIILNTKHEMKRITTFLNIPFEEAITRQKNNQDKDVMRVGKLGHHSNLYKPLFKDSINKWEREMDLGLVRELRPTLKNSAFKLGYTV